MPSPEQLAGPTGAIVALIAVLGIAARVIQVLWQNHLEADRDDRAQRDRALGLLDLSLQNNRDAIAAWEQRDRTDAARTRRGDGR